MHPGTQTDVDFRRAEAALRWAREVTQEPELPDGGPEKPTAAELRSVPVAVVRQHLDGLLLGKHPEPGLDALERLGVLDAWLPEVASMVGFGDGEWRHKDVWKHTKQVVRQSVPRIEVRWGALLHDIGKPKTRSTDERGRIHFHGHAEVGAAMFRKRVKRRLQFEGDLADRLHFLILHHLRASQYDGTWTDTAVRRFYREMGEGLTDLLDLSRADITTKRPHRRKRGLRSISDLAARIRSLQQVDNRKPPLPKGLGNEITKELAFRHPSGSEKSVRFSKRSATPVSSRAAKPPPTISTISLNIARSSAFSSTARPGSSLNRPKNENGPGRLRPGRQSSSLGVSSGRLRRTEARLARTTVTSRPRTRHAGAVSGCPGHHASRTSCCDRHRGSCRPSPGCPARETARPDTAAPPCTGCSALRLARAATRRDGRPGIRRRPAPCADHRQRQASCND